MYLAFLDEADHTSRKNFTVCGLTAVKIDNAPKLCADIESLRSSTGKLEQTDFLKFVTGKSSKLSPDEHLKIKKSVMEKAKHRDVVFWGYAHFSGGPATFDADRDRIFGFNALIYKFNSFLKKKRDFGTVTIDRLDISKKSKLDLKNGFDYIREKFQKGNYYKNDKLWLEHDRVLSFAQACEGSSHLCSVNDILTGSLMYMVNGQDPAVRNALKTQLQEVMATGPDGKFRDHGLSYYPKDKSKLASSVVSEYENLRDFLNST